MGNYKPGGPKGRFEEKAKINEDRLRKVISGDAKELNEYANELAESYVKGKPPLTTSQIRHVLDEIQRLREFDENRLQLLRPKLAYAAGKQGRGAILEFQRILDKAINMTTKENYQNFKNFVEALVAYHRCHGGREG